MLSSLFFIFYQPDIQFGIITIIFAILGFASYRLSPATAKWTSTICGLANFIWVFQRGNCIYLFLAVLVILFVVLKVNRSRSHVVSVCLTMTYITWFKISYYPHACLMRYPDLLTMALVLKLIGLGFEVHNSHVEQKDGKSKSQGIVDPTFADAFHYVFGVVGNNAGQYIRYRTFADAYRLPYRNTEGLKEFLRRAQQLIPIIIIQRILEPIKYDYNFYNGNILMMTAQLVFFGFRSYLFIYISLLFNYLITVAFNVGAYPQECCSESGHGPTLKYDQLEELCMKKDVKYDFNTVLFFEAKSNFTPYFKDSIKSWNKTIQYFLFKYIYKQCFPTRSKEFRIYFTGFFSALWHGTELGNYFTLFFLWPTFSTRLDPLIKSILSTKGGSSTIVRYGLIFIKLVLWIFSFVFVSSLYIEKHLNISDNVAYLFVLSICCMYLLDARKKKGL